jgi:hypothetical protein
VFSLQALEILVRVEHYFQRAVVAEDSLRGKLRSTVLQMDVVSSPRFLGFSGSDVLGSEFLFFVISRSGGSNQPADMSFPCAKHVHIFRALAGRVSFDLYLWM